jgi:hypothetical protein
MMADNQLLLGDDDVGGGDDVFVYTGGEQRVSRDVKRVRIAENVDTILDGAFRDCEQLTEVEGHNKLKKIERSAFISCTSLRTLRNMQCVIEIEHSAFCNCHALSELEFDKLEIIGEGAFIMCKSLAFINIPSTRSLGPGAFLGCDALTDAVFGKDLEDIEQFAFRGNALRRIVIPLKDNLIVANTSFSNCGSLSRVDTIDGGIHETISTLHMEGWRDEMEGEIDRINQTLPNTRAFEKARAIQEWLTTVFSRMEHYKTEHQILLKEAMALLELALWKATLLNETDEKKFNTDDATKKAIIVTEAARKEQRVTCGASIVIKNVLPFLALK